MKRYLKKLLNNFGDIVSNYKSFVGRIGLVGISNILIALSSLIFIPIITKSFSTAEYGMWTQILTTVALLPNIANLGLPYTMVRFLSASRVQVRLSPQAPSATISGSSASALCEKSNANVINTRNKRVNRFFMKSSRK